MSTKHLSIAEYGSSLHLKGQRLIVNNGKEILGEYPLSRLRTVSVGRRGVSFSSNLLAECANRGIRFFIFNFNQQATVCLSGAHQHAVVAVRRAQLQFLETQDCVGLAAQIIYGKIRNQRSTLLYFSKYINKTNAENFTFLSGTAERLAILADKARKLPMKKCPVWRNELLGLEGNAAAHYWDSLKKVGLFGQKFPGRRGRGAQDIFNQALNIGYAILSSYVWNALINAGLECYAGCLHVNRPGKPSLVLDVMEEYRPWTVDRSIAKMRYQLESVNEIKHDLKVRVISEIHGNFCKKYKYKNKKLKLENILQRQVYRLAGAFAERKKYSPYLFLW